MANMVYKFTSKEVTPLKPSSWPLRIKIQSLEKVGSSIDSSVAGLTAMKSTLVNPSRSFEREI